MKSFFETKYSVVFFVLLFVALFLSFLLGREVGGNVQKNGEPMVLSCEKMVSTVSVQSSDSIEDSTPLTASVVSPTDTQQKKGKYVGSKNGTKYYTPGCSGTNRIKPENYIWFESSEDAMLQGYTKGSC